MQAVKIGLSLSIDYLYICTSRTQTQSNKTMPFRSAQLTVEETMLDINQIKINIRQIYTSLLHSENSEVAFTSL